MGSAVIEKLEDLILPLPAPVLPHWHTEKIFGNHNPIEIDAGSGKGRFLLARAQDHPKTNFIGIEWQNKRVHKVAKKAFRADCQNIRLVRTEITFLLENLIADNTIQTLYVFYPDPWPKRRHHNRRLMQPAFLQLAASKLQPGGKLHFATDNVAYASATQKIMEEQDLLQPCAPFIPAPHEKTDFELLFEKQGLLANRLSLQKPTE
jgi:tRNA (guanine-N7-)-methyltransferase